LSALRDILDEMGSSLGARHVEVAVGETAGGIALIECIDAESVMPVASLVADAIDGEVDEDASVRFDLHEQRVFWDALSRAS
jgi:hypothetical protein